MTCADLPTQSTEVLLELDECVSTCLLVPSQLVCAQVEVTCWSSNQCVYTQVPFLFKYTVDALAIPDAADVAAVPDMYIALGLAGVPVALIGAFGLARAGGTILSELRNAVFAKVAQGAIRKVGGQVSPFLLPACLQVTVEETSCGMKLEQCHQKHSIECFAYFCTVSVKESCEICRCFCT